MCFTISIQSWNTSHDRSGVGLHGSSTISPQNASHGASHGASQGDGRDKSNETLLFPPWDTDLKLCTNRDASVSPNPAMGRRKARYKKDGDAAESGTAADGMEDEKCADALRERQVDDQPEHWIADHADTSWMKELDGHNAQDNVY